MLTSFELGTELQKNMPKNASLKLTLNCKNNFGYYEVTAYKGNMYGAILVNIQNINSAEINSIEDNKLIYKINVNNYL
jgi:hypothetical protein